MCIFSMLLYMKGTTIMCHTTLLSYIPYTNTYFYRLFPFGTYPLAFSYAREKMLNSSTMDSGKILLILPLLLLLLLIIITLMKYNIFCYKTEEKKT